MARRPVPKRKYRHQTYFEVYGRRYSPYDRNWRMANRPRQQSTQIKRIRARIRAEKRAQAAAAEAARIAAYERAERARVYRENMRWIEQQEREYELEHDMYEITRGHPGYGSRWE